MGDFHEKYGMALKTAPNQILENFGTKTSTDPFFLALKAAPKTALKTALTSSAMILLNKNGTKNSTISVPFLVPLFYLIKTALKTALKTAPLLALSIKIKYTTINIVLFNNKTVLTISNDYDKSPGRK